MSTYERNPKKERFFFFSSLVGCSIEERVELWKELVGEG